jgi:hypothetical protein
VLRRTTSNSNTQDEPRPELGEATTFPLIVYSAPLHGDHIQMVFLSWNSQVGIPKFQQLGLSRPWRRITSCADLRSRWGLKKSCSPRRDLFNSVSHVACTQGNRVDSRLLMVGSQTVNLTPDLSFGHNLCFKCSNEQCKPILDTYTSIAFQWYKELFKGMGFDPYNCVLKIRESFRDSNSQHGNSFVSMRVHSLTLFTLPRTCEVTPESPFWPATL